jgi:hypothetical protein
MTFAVNEGAASVRSRKTFGAGAIMRVLREGAIRVCSDRTSGAGGTTAEFREGAVRGLSEDTAGAGAMMAFSETPPRDRSRVTLTGAGAIIFAGKLGAVSEECRPSDGGGPGSDLIFDLNASRLATAPLDEGSFRSGASTTCCASELPRATRIV